MGAAAYEEGESKEEGDKRRGEESLLELEAILNAVKDHLMAFDRHYLTALLRTSHSEREREGRGVMF